MNVGQILLWLCLLSSVFASISGVLGSKRADWARVGRFSSVAVFSLSSSALVILALAFLGDDFSFRYVALHSCYDLPWVYKLTAVWAGQEGSLLFWLWVLSAFSLTFLLRNRDRLSDGALPVLSLVQTFFCLLVLRSDPFLKLPFVPEDGRGLNPLLESPWMVLHPPSLYLGYIGFTVPFALSLAGVASGDEAWMERSKRWFLFSWTFLTLGILTGMKWSYVVLGWGGYWAWDPVENASLMPWLTATAFLHSPPRRKSWSFFLVVVTFELTIFGTFLTRSGFVSSVHAFARSPLGYYFLAFILLSGGSAGWIGLRGRGKERSEGGIMFLSGLVLCALCLVTFLGTIFPAVSELLSGRRMALGPGFFNTIFAPLGLSVFLLFGICRKGLKSPLPLGISALSLYLVLRLGARGPYPILAALFGGFALGNVLLQALRFLRSGDFGRFGRDLVHIGTVIFAFGAYCSSLGTEEEVEGVGPGEDFRFGGYDFTLEGFSPEPKRGRMLLKAKLRVKEGREEFTLSPGMEFYEGGQTTYKVEVRSGLLKDLYVAMTEVTRDAASFYLKVVPGASFIWSGGCLVLAGAFLSLVRRKHAAFR
ncbi:MAG: hypothetical protein DRP94_00645 [Candidatus Latescibacterota bacterium]|nr:MAG: hypothetical protein DRP94_00645 [Candidatus Latescibacterota bacterium]